MFTKTLIIDNRKELSTKYKKILEDNVNHVEIIKDISLALNFIQKNEPDLIIISDSIDENLCEFCERIRVLTYNMRPIIVAMSKSADSNDKIKVLESGADDFISEPVNAEEFKIRIKAHIRREYETNLDVKTKLPTKKYCYKAIKRALASEKDWGCLLTGIDNYYNYKETYSEIASDKLIQTFAAIITSSLDENDYFGLLTDRDFLIITSPVKIEKIASFMTFAFEAVKNKFYSEQDLKRGYMMKFSEDFSEQRCEFVNATTGGITNETKHFSTPEEVIHELKQAYNLAKNKSTSNYLIERPQISAKNSTIQKEFNNKILIFEKDEALSLLLSTTLGLKGYATKNFENFETIKDFEPALIIFDTGESIDNNSLSICKDIKKYNSKIKIITTSIFHDKENILNAGADIYLPKPYSIDTLAKWVNSAIKEFNN